MAAHAQGGVGRSDLQGLVRTALISLCPPSLCDFQFALSSGENIFIFYIWMIVSSFICTVSLVNVFVL